MKVLTRRGSSKPLAKDLDTWQLGFNNADAEEGATGTSSAKTLFIKDDEGNVVPVVNLSGYLKEQFLYNIPTNKPSDMTDYPDREYDQSTAESFFGLTAGLNRVITGIKDENGAAVGNHIKIDFMSIDPATYEFQTTTQNSNAESVAAGEGSVGTGKVRSIEFDTVSKEYIAKLKNAIEQKAVFTVETKATTDDENNYGYKQNLDTLLAYLQSDEVLGAEYGVQAIVKADETHNGDTWLYVLEETKTTTTDEESGETTTTSTFTWSETMPLEYLFHDPVGVHGLKVYSTSDDENTSNVGLDEEYLRLVSQSVKGATFNCVEVTDGVNGATHRNIVTFTPNQSEVLDGDVPEAFNINFDNFVLDEGSWD